MATHNDYIAVLGLNAAHDIFSRASELELRTLSAFIAAEPERAPASLAATLAAFVSNSGASRELQHHMATIDLD